MVMVIDHKKELRERKKIGEEWRSFRQSRLFTQDQLAKVLGMSKRQVANIEAGVSRPRMSTASKFQALKAKHERGKGESNGWSA